MRSLAWLFRLAAAVLAGALLVTSVVVAVAPRLWGVANSHDEGAVELPDFEPLSRRSLVYDRNGNLIDIYEQENSQPVDLDAIPDRVIEAFLVVEDREFYEHDGVNLRSLVRATLSNFASDAPQQGASTITMQVVKNEFLAGMERDGRYKLLQIHYARMLENELTKPEILERYLNTVFFGNNSYGIQAAAETYFAKNVGELTMIESAFLAGLVRAPTTYDPINNPERSRNRFIQVLERLRDDGEVTRRGARRIGKEFVLPERVRSLPSEQTTPSYYTAALREYLLQRSTILGDTFEERYNVLYRGGLRIHTTLDPAMQLQAAAARNQVPQNSAGIDAAVVSLDTQTGAIRAMIGGSGYVPGENEVNMALAPRQTGSSVKLFVLAAALQAGALPDDIVDGSTPCSFPIPDQPGQSYDIDGSDARGGGLWSIEQNTYASINCAYVRLSMIVGLNRVVDMTYRMAESPYFFKGQSEDDRTPMQPIVATATGNNEISALDLASGGQTIANDGVHHQPYYIDRIETEQGQEIYRHFDEGAQVLDRNVALTAVKIMKTVLGPEGTGRLYPLADGRPAAGKTGTQAENTNATFVGFTPQLTTAVWMGDPDEYTSMDNANVPEFPENVQGGRLPTLIWKTFMDAALAGKPMLDWQEPAPPFRYPARLFLPGKECANIIVRYETEVIGYGFQSYQNPGYQNPGTEPPGTEPPSTQPPETPPPPPPPTEPPATEPPRTEPPSTRPPATRRPTTTTTTGTRPPGPTVPRTTRAPVPITRVVPVYDDLVATTIPSDVLNPNAPLPSVPLNQTVFSC